MKGPPFPGYCTPQPSSTLPGWQDPETGWQSPSGHSQGTEQLFPWKPAGQEALQLWSDMERQAEGWVKWGRQAGDGQGDFWALSREVQEMLHRGPDLGPWHSPAPGIPVLTWAPSSRHCRHSPLSQYHRTPEHRWGR